MLKSNTKMNEKRLRINFTKCNCDKIITAYYEAPPGCADDNAAVAALPDKWVPRHSGPILADYLIKREHDHDKVLQDIADSAKKVNDRIDSKIRSLAEALLAHLHYNSNQMDCVAQHYDTSGTELDKEQHDKAHKEIYQLYSQRIDEMACFKREALALERKRVEGLTIVFRNQFQKLISVGHLTPRDLLHDFDERVYQINQQLLSNTRAYVDLEAQLRVQADENVASARSAINQLCLGTSMKDRAQSALLRDPADRPYIQRSASAIGETSMISVWSTSTEVELIDACIMRLVQIYKTAVLRIFNVFSARLVDLGNELGNNIFFIKLDSHTSTEFRQMIDKAVSCLSSSIHKNHIASREWLETTGAEVLTMQKKLWSLGECLQDTFNVLHDAGHLWDNHILRQALAQKLTIAAVEDLLTRNDAIEMANEVAFNIALEHLRGCSDLDKLQVEYGIVTGMLERSAEMYRLHSQAELGRLEQFMDLPVLLANILLSEFRCFLDRYPRYKPLGSASLNSEQFSTPKASAETLLSPLPRAILMTELQELALCNWRNGFLESFENNVSLVPEEFQRQARVWVEERANALHMRFSVKMVSHSIRVERVKAARETRFAELKHHQTRLISHLDALNQLIVNLPKDALLFPTQTTPLYPYNDWMTNIRKNVYLLTQNTDSEDHETIYLKMCSYASRIVNHRRLYEESISTAIEQYKISVENRVQNVRISSVRLMAQITLFSQGGQYSAQEATRACSYLLKGADALELCVGKVMESLNLRRTQILQQADQVMVPLQRTCNDFIASGRPKASGGKPR